MHLSLKKILLLFVLLCTFSPLFGEPPAGGELAVGPFLYIREAESCRVYLDNRLQGETPLVLENIPTGRYQLKIESDKEVCRQGIEVQPGIKNLTVFEPEMIPLTGYLTLRSRAEGADVFLDGELIGQTPLTEYSMEVGSCLLELRHEDYLTRTVSLDVKKGESLNLNVDMSRTYEVSFSEPLPAESQAFFRLGETEAVFHSGEEVRLVSGTWEYEITGKTFDPVSGRVFIDDRDAVIPVSIAEYAPDLLFGGLKKKSIVYVDNEEISALILNDAFSVSPGLHDIYITTPNYDPIALNLSVGLVEEVDLDLTYVRSEKYKKGRNALIGGSLVALGAGLCTGGVVMGSNDRLVSMTSDYDQYKMYKYYSYGAVATGAVLSLVGSFMLVKAF